MELRVSIITHDTPGWLMDPMRDIVQVESHIVDEDIFDLPLLRQFFDTQFDFITIYVFIRCTHVLIVPRPVLQASDEIYLTMFWLDGRFLLLSYTVNVSLMWDFATFASYIWHYNNVFQHFDAMQQRWHQRGGVISRGDFRICLIATRLLA
jgi:hypothetical protein